VSHPKANASLFHARAFPPQWRSQCPDRLTGGAAGHPASMVSGAFGGCVTVARKTPIVTVAKSNTNAEPADTWFTRERVLVIVLAIVTLAVCVLVFRLVEPFIPAITWALVLAVMAHPMHEAIVRRLRRPWLAAGLAVFAVTVVVALPATFVARQIASEALESAEAMRALLDSDRWKANLERFPQLAPLRQWVDEQVDIRAEFKRASEAVAKGVRGFFARSLQFLAGTFITLFLLFYWLRDKRRLLEKLRKFVPLAPPETNQVLAKVGHAIHAIVYGTLAVAAVQGILGGLMFWWLGLPAPLLWGTVMALVAVLPVFGAAIVWVPAALYLAAEGDWQRALALATWGAIVVSMIDNVLYPILVKSEIRLHTVPIFIAVLGGLIVFGATGVVLGPLVLVVALALLDIWRRRMAAGEVETGVDRRR
jgi:predicted PurR-regulated permease PerM